MIQVSKTDSRHTGSEKFKFFASIKTDRETYSRLPNQTINALRRKLEEFDNVRKWCVDTWGMSCERSMYLMMKDSPQLNPHWCWHTEHDNFKIYFVSEADVNWFKLKWE